MEFKTYSQTVLLLKLPLNKKHSHKLIITNFLFFHLLPLQKEPLKNKHSYQIQDKKHCRQLCP